MFHVKGKMQICTAPFLSFLPSFFSKHKLRDQRRKCSPEDSSLGFYDDAYYTKDTNKWVKFLKGSVKRNNNTWPILTLRCFRIGR
jgi:hypothetical protein